MEGTLLMLPLGAQRDELLNKVCQEGGFAYVALIMLAATGDVHAAEAAHDMAWEQLHSAPWDTVEPIWRDAYSLSCLHMASFHHHAGKENDALRVLDMGLIMGGPLLRPDLNSAISFIQGERTLTNNDSEGAEDVFIGTESADSSIQEAVKVEETDSENGSDLSHCSNHSHVSGGPLPHKHIELCLKEGTTSSKNHPSNRVKRKLTDLGMSDQQRRPSEMYIGSLFSKVLQGLPHQSFCFKFIEKRHLLSLEDFLCNFFLPGFPVIISGAMSHWPAMNKWKDMEYLKQTVGNRTVPVEVGQHYLAAGWKQELITISQLLERIQSKEQLPRGLTYLAQHPLFDQISQLHGDILVPDYCNASNGKLHSVNAWFGPTGTVTPLHHDPHHNLLAQVIGRKYVRLYSALVSEELYPYSEPMLSNSSQVDLDNLDPAKFPRAEQLSFMDCILDEGEMLYIPPRWWHYVKSLSTSFSVSFWWNVVSNDDDDDDDAH